MFLLASGLDGVQKIIITVLCIAAAVFILSDVILVLSLHRSNKKLVKSQKEKSDEAVGKDK